MVRNLYRMASPGVAITIIVAIILCAEGQNANTHIELHQGPIVGLKIFPEASRTAVYSFLGIPYAEAPLGDLRFALPRPHGGWNRTLFARDIKPLCPQLSNSIYDETPERVRIYGPIMDEDCLYLNVWVPEAAFRYQNLPVLVIITGEEMSFDWALNRPTGLDLSADGIVVITIQYRMNIFGWLGTNTLTLPGNYGLHDQALALKWVQENVHKFGGNPKQVTLLGHGTSGVSCALIHMLSPHAKELFSKVALMSGSVKFFEPMRDQSASEQIIAKLGCQFEKSQVVECLRSKSTSDLQKAFESIYRNGNYSDILGPVIDDFRPILERYVPKMVDKVLKSGKFRKLPLIIGIGSNEGAFIRDYWIDLAREGLGSLQLYINQTIIPKIISKYFPLRTDHNGVLKALNWRYFDSVPKTPSGYLNSLQRLISETGYEVPFYDTIELFSKAKLNSDNASLFVYSLQIPHSMDMRGKVNLFGGASHSADLPLLMGPSLFQQIARRRLTSGEDKICRQVRSVFAEFVKTGNPTPGRLYDAWLTYTSDRKYIKILGEPDEGDRKPTQFEENIKDIEQLLEGGAGSGTSPRNPYQIGNRDLDQEGRRSKKTYLMNQNDYEYYTHLREVHTFWTVLLPGMGENPLLSNQTRADPTTREILLMEASIDVRKYKNAFVSMLVVVCILLACMGICVYLLRKHHPSLSATL